MARQAHRSRNTKIIGINSQSGKTSNEYVGCNYKIGYTNIQICTLLTYGSNYIAFFQGTPNPIPFIIPI